MKPIIENPDFKAVTDKLTQIQTDIQREDRRKEEIQIELLKPHKADNDNAFQTYLTNEGGYATDRKKELREEFQYIDSRQEFLRTALEQGQKELDKIRGRLSLEAAKLARPKYLAAIKRQLAALREVLAANADMRAIHDELQQNGYRSDQLPAATFDLGGVWNDQFGGRVVGQQRYIAEHFPELRKDTE